MQIIIDKKSNAWANIRIPFEVYIVLKKLSKEWRLPIWKVIAIILMDSGYDVNVKL